MNDIFSHEHQCMNSNDDHEASLMQCYFIFCHRDFAIVKLDVFVVEVCNI